MRNCPLCGKEVVAGISYCNHCGFKLSGEKGGGGGVRSAEVKPELLVSAMVGLFILGLVAIAVLIGVLKQIAGFDLPFLLATIIFSFVLMLLVEGVLIRLLFKSTKAGKATTGGDRPGEQAVKEIYAAPPAQALSEPTFQPLSVTDHTTRTLEHTPNVQS